MTDIAHTFGQDLTFSATGDLLTSDGTALGEQRVLRRLFTNPGDYLWVLQYGAGLRAMVGQPANSAQIAAIIRSQMRQEPVVSPMPAPTASVSVNPNGTVVANIQYVDAATGNNQAITLQVPN